MGRGVSPDVTVELLIPENYSPKYSVKDSLKSMTPPLLDLTSLELLPKLSNSAEVFGTEESI